MSLDALDLKIERETQAARDAIVELAEREPGRWWSAFELKSRARGQLSSAVMGLAMRGLVRDGVFEQGANLLVRLRPAANR